MYNFYLLFDITWDAVKDYIRQNQIEIFVTIILFPIMIHLIRKIFKSLFAENNTGKAGTIQKNSNTIIVNPGISHVIGESSNSERQSINHIKLAKSVVNILFVDDDTTFKVVKILKQSGWLNTKLIKDLKSLSTDELLRSQIIFTDIRGVGKLLGFQDEGLGLAAAIKEKFPEKMVVIYSSEQSGNRFHKGFRLADDMLAKNAEPYEFISTIEQMTEKLIANGTVSIS